MEILQWSNYCSQRLVLSLLSLLSLSLLLSSSSLSSLSSLSLLLSLLDFPDKQVPIEKLLNEKKEGFEPVADSSNKSSSSVKKSKVKVPINDDEGNNSPRVQLKSSPTPLKSTKQSSTSKKASQVIDLSLDD